MTSTCQTKRYYYRVQQQYGQGFSPQYNMLSPVRSGHHSGSLENSISPSCITLYYTNQMWGASFFFFNTKHLSISLSKVLKIKLVEHRADPLLLNRVGGHIYLCMKVLFLDGPIFNHIEGQLAPSIRQPASNKIMC